MLVLPRAVNCLAAKPLLRELPGGTPRLAIPAIEVLAEIAFPFLHHPIVNLVQDALTDTGYAPFFACAACIHPKENPLSVFSLREYDHHEQVVFSSDPSSGLKLIIAIFSTTRGPAIGGLRFWPYHSEQGALADVLRLAKGMAYKAAIAGLSFGGGKAVVIQGRGLVKSDQMLHAIGTAIDRLGGRYITGEDVGSTVDDMAIIRDKTRYVLGTPARLGGSGDPSPSTALGCYHGIRACLKHVFGNDSLDCIRVAVQGTGSVGSRLCRLLTEEGAKLYLCDLDREKAKALAIGIDATPVDHHEIYDLDVDVFSPCALGSILNAQTVNRLRAKIVAGAANNQLASNCIGTLLHKRGILYAPDYAINGGGLIQLAIEWTTTDSPGAYNNKTVARRVSKIHEVLMEVFQRADADGVPSYLAADRIAEERLRHNVQLQPGCCGRSK